MRPGTERPWPAVEAARNIGLYGHVVPVVLSSPGAYHRGAVFTCSDPASDRLYYKIEYWQFFGYNYVHHDGATDHEAD